MWKMLVIVFMLLVPLVRSLCSPSQQSSDAAQCDESILTNLNLPAAVVGTLGDFVQCVLDGTTEQCRFECTLGFLAAGCVGDVYQTCINNQQHACWSACSGGINVLNQGCLDTALDVLTLTPGVGGIVAIAVIFFNCVDILGCGVSWVLDALFNAVLTLSSDAKTDFCTSLHKIIGQNGILSGVLSFFKW